MDLSSLFFVTVLAVSAPSGKTEALRAYYKQSGAERKVRVLERKTIPEEMRPYLGYGAALTRLVVDGTVTFKWTFP